MRRIVVVIAVLLASHAGAQEEAGPCGGVMFARGKVVMGKALAPDGVASAEGQACLAHVAQQLAANAGVVGVTIQVKVSDELRLQGVAANVATQVKAQLLSAGVAAEKVSVVAPRGEPDEPPTVTLTYAEVLARPVARVDLVDGELRVGPASATTWETVGQGAMILERQRVKVGPGATALLTFYDGSRWSLQGGTELLLQAKVVGESHVFRVIMETGALQVLSPPTTSAVPLELELRGVSARASGGAVRAFVDDRGTRLEVTRGKIAVQTSQGTEELQPGQTISVDPQRNRGPAQTLMPAPLLISSAPTDAQTLNWKPVDGAARYTVEYARDADFVWQRTELDVGETATALPDAGPGKWFWRVRAVSADGHHGEPSQVRSVLR